jgi:predicted peroxiredoxin
VTPPSSDVVSTVLFSVTSDVNEDPQAVDMALKLAGFSLDEGRHVVMFFNVKGVTIPSNALADDFAFQQDKPIKMQLVDLIQRGVDVHVCPICMKALGVGESDLIEGAKVTTRPGLFANINANTAVFTY